MAKPTCVKCGSSQFGMTTQNLKDVNHEYSFIHCSSCGTVVGVVNEYNIANLLLRVCDHLGIDVKTSRPQ